MPNFKDNRPLLKVFVVVPLNWSKRQKMLERAAVAVQMKLPQYQVLQINNPQFAQIHFTVANDGRNFVLRRLSPTVACSYL